MIASYRYAAAPFASVARRCRAGISVEHNIDPTERFQKGDDANRLFSD
jgi:hypothetical protein